MDFKLVVVLAMLASAGAGAGLSLVAKPGAPGAEAAAPPVLEASAEPTEYYASCDTNYRQSMPYLSRPYARGTCECFDAAIRPLARVERAGVARSMDELLTVAFMGGRGDIAKHDDPVLGTVTGRAKVTPRARAVFAQCGMFDW